MPLSQLKQINPVLPAANMEITIDFWQRLGFFKVYDSGQYGELPINYAVMKRDNLCIHLQLFKDFEKQHSPQLRSEVSEVFRFLEELKAAGLVDRQAELRATPWGTREFGVFDPNQVGITFFESIS